MLRLVCGCKRLVRGATIWWLLAHALAFAQTGPAPDLTSLSIEELARVKVFSASRHMQDSQDAPAAVSIITADDIARYGWRTLADALRSLRGFYTAYDRNYTYLGVRGFLRSGDYNSRILLLLNGHRLNDNGYDGAMLGTEFPLDLDLVDHIEIVRGPSSSLYGTNAVFGVINVITRRSEVEPAIEVSGDASSFLGRTGRITANLQKGRLSALLSGSMYRSTGQTRLFFPAFASPETNNGVAVDSDGERYSQAFADVQYGGWRCQGLFGGRTKIIPTASFSTNFNDPGTRTSDTRGYLDVSYHRDFSSRTTLDLRTFYDALDYHGTYAYGGTDSPERRLNSDEGRADWVGAEVLLGRQLGNHRITAGGDYEYSLRVDQINHDVHGPTYFNDHRTPSLAAGFIDAELKLHPQLILHAGGRVDWLDDFGKSFSPRLALVYSPGSRTALKYLFGRAFRAPNLYETYYSDGLTISPNPHLRSENIETHEVVLERSLASWLRITAGAYHNDLRNLIEQKPDAASGMVKSVNTGHDAGRGLEFELEAKRSSGWSARASYTLTDTRDQVDHSLLDSSPTNIAKLATSLPVSRQGSVGLELLYTSAQTTYQETRIPPSFLANITFSTRPILGGWQFSASCYNALNRRWFSPAGPAHREADIPQDGRTFRVKLSYRIPLPGARKAN